MSLLSIFLWTAGAAIIFGLSNALAYARGNNSGYTEGLLDGAKAKIREIAVGKYEVEIGDGEE